ncbi:alpha/beta hydrolase-fold protein [Mycobacterium sp. OTB74]|uniref:alpha/beta hydrolase-fold protein n=1 Tax=Mycobacterium sp. OTB74 TaxID=1853452 RepID=UPI002472E833|nr:alpha/beta hydrolase-fold protein [Mycobacterium sp. OTB74]
MPAIPPVVAPNHHGLSLLYGWLPITIQAVAAIVLLLAIGWRGRRWRFLWLPVAVIIGVIAAAWAIWFTNSQGLAGNPAPNSLWIWVGLTGLAVGVLLLGWRGAPWWRRGVAVLAVPLCLLGSGVALNNWVGYFPTVQTAWGELTAGPLTDQTDMSTVTAMKTAGTVPSHGQVVQVDIPDTGSGFNHRTEIVYLPPAWFAHTAPSLPTIMMIAGEFNTPADWLRIGNVASIADNFAATHGGSSPVFVFVDTGGSFNNDTECVNGPRGNVADHLTKDVVPYMTSTFGVSAAAANWGIVGWSMGATCSVDLVVMHPELFSTFVDIAGDMGPNAGTKDQTIARLYGGDAAQWAAFDPTTVMTKHGPYQGVSGWFAISSDAPSKQQHWGDSHPDAVGLGGRDGAGNPGDQTEAANSLCTLGSRLGIDCAIVKQPGKHDWPFAVTAFQTSLPWLAGQVGTPGVPKVGFPAGSTSPASSGSPATSMAAGPSPTPGR